MCVSATHQLLESDRRAIGLLESELILHVAFIVLSRKSMGSSCSIFITYWPWLPHICALRQLLHSSSMGRRHARLLDSTLRLVLLLLPVSLLHLLCLEHLPMYSVELTQLCSQATWPCRAAQACMHSCPDSLTAELRSKHRFDQTQYLLDRCRGC